MGARHPRDLVAWQLARQLKLRVYGIIARPTVRRDLRFCDQIREASASAETNIAEGFWRYAPRDFARFLAIARASLGEVQNHLQDGRDRGHLDRVELDELTLLSSRAIGAVSRLHTYLRQKAEATRNR